MNPSEHHRLMAMRVQYGTSAMCMAMNPPDQRECVPTSSGEIMSMAVPTRQVSALMTEMMFEALTKRSP